MCVCVCVSATGLGRLFGEDLVVVRRASARHAAWPLCRDLRPGGELREHADCCRQLRQDHPRLVPSDLCPRRSAAGTHWLHYLATGEADLLLFTLK